MMRSKIAALLCLTFTTTGVFAVGTSHWTHTNEADFKNGTMSNVVATNLGDLKLSRAVKTILEQDPKVSSVYALAEAKDGTIYAGTGPQGVLLQIKGEKVSEALKLDDGVNIFSLLIDRDGDLLIGTGGENGKVLKLGKPGDKPKEVFSGEGVQYVWAMKQTPDGNIYAATGPDGQLYEIKPDGSHDLLMDTDENNLLSLVSDGKDLLYVGTDPNGLVYRVNRKTKEIYVVHDAAESEVSALALDTKGNLYAGTAEATPAEGETEAAGASEQIGRPESGTTGAPIPSPTPPEPKPPELPNPNPGEPDPIPKKLMILQSLLASPAASAPSRATSTSRASSPPRKSATARSLDDGQSQAKNPATSPTSTSRAPNPPMQRTEGAGKARVGGNAIYKIDPSGLVIEIFRQPVLVLSIIEQDAAPEDKTAGPTLLVGTGSDGLIYQINPAAEETIVLAKVEPKQVMCMMPARDGRVLLGLANTGGIDAMTKGFAGEGTFTSAVLDASQVSRFGHVQLHGSLPAGTGLTVATRSGNVSEVSDIGWSQWTPAAPAAEFVTVEAPAARFLQYRLAFSSADGKKTAIVDDVDVSYQEPNLPPDVKSLKIATAGKVESADQPPPPIPALARMQTISWEASDPNSDEMTYSLFFRNGSRSPWILLKDKLKEPTFDWDTLAVADGRYEVKVTASDALANAPAGGRTTARVSDLLQVDNTPPVITHVKASSGAGEVRVEAEAMDRSSTLAAFGYAVDSGQDWQTVMPSDNIADSPDEKLSFAIPGLSPGQHQVTLRAVDSRGNRALATVSVTVDAQASK